MDLELAEKVVVVTGGSDGLGLALSHRLVREGARVALCARNEERLAFAGDELRQDGGDVVEVVADVTVPDDLAHLVDVTTKRWGRIDGLVNNAGRASAMAVADSTDEVWDQDLQLKLYAAVRLTRLALPALRRQGGAIVNVLAIAAKTPGPRSTPTSVSRAAGMALTKALSLEVAPDAIRVNAVLVGLIESGQWVRSAAHAGVSTDQLYERMAGDMTIPLGRVGRGSEFADLVTFLLSPRASYVTGTAINVDGGLCAAL